MGRLKVKENLKSVLKNKNKNKNKNKIIFLYTKFQNTLTSLTYIK
jgi:hypothetical protein